MAEAVSVFHCFSVPPLTVSPRAQKWFAITLIIRNYFQLARRSSLKLALKSREGGPRQHSLVPGRLLFLFLLLILSSLNFSHMRPHGTRAIMTTMPFIFSLVPRYSKRPIWAGKGGKAHGWWISDLPRPGTGWHLPLSVAFEFWQSPLSRCLWYLQAEDRDRSVARTRPARRGVPVCGLCSSRQSCERVLSPRPLKLVQRGFDTSLFPWSQNQPQAKRRFQHPTQTLVPRKQRRCPQQAQLLPLCLAEAGLQDPRSPSQT